MSAPRLVATLGTMLVAAAFSLNVSTATAAVQSKDEQKCTNTVHKNGTKSAKVTNKAEQKCLKNFAKGKPLDNDNPSIDTLEECIVNDGKGKALKQRDKGAASFDKFCSPLPEFGVTDGFIVDAAARAREGDLMHDVLGSDLDAGQIAAESDGGDAKDAVKCQQKAFKSLTKCVQAREKQFLKCLKSGLKDGSIDEIGDVEACYDGADPAKIQKKCTGIPGAGMQKDVQKCEDTVDDRTLLQMFPGCGENDVPSVTTCFDEAAKCRFCQAANAAAGGARDCDLFDDGLANASCETAPAGPCEPLNALQCMLPYPSSHFQVAASTATGLQLNFPDEGLPTLSPPLVADPFNELDGYNPMGAMLMHFPQGVDPELSNAARLLEPGCCGQPAGPPWIDTRTYTDRSLDPNSPSVLIKADTGERVLHFIEPDGRVVGDPANQVLFLRPAVSLEPNTRYIVAMRNLKDEGDSDVVAEAPFAALRDNTPTGDVATESRRGYYEANIFPQLLSAGIARDDLVLAYDFTTQSESQLTRQILAMRDLGRTYIDARHADPNDVMFTSTIVTENDCNDPNEVIWRHVNGTFEAPLFLTAAPTFGNVPQHSVDPNDIPVQNGTMDANYDVTIPCSVHDPNTPSRPIVLGHGIFGTAESMVLGVPAGLSQTVPWTYIAGGTEWLGLSNGGLGQLWVAGSIVGLGSSQLNNFPAFVDRLRQGMSNQLVLARMMKLGTFNRDAAFQLGGGGGVFPGVGEEMYYHGISLGGIMGTYFSGLTPDVERFSVDVPAASFGCLLQRSTQFAAFEALLPPIGLDVGLEQALGTGALIHELWISAEPGSVLRRITSNPLPGSGSASKLLLSVGWLDLQVSNQCTNIMARTLGVPNVASVQQGLVGIPDSLGPEDSGMTIYDTGWFDLFNPTHAAEMPGLSNTISPSNCDPHNGPRSTPASHLQITNFLQPGGQILNFCTGSSCDAVDTVEQPSFVCDPNDPN